MRTDNWFFAAVGPVDGGNAIEKHLCEVRADHPTAVLRTFENRGQQVDLLYPRSMAVVETAQFWLGIVCPRPPAESLRLALRSASSLAELKGISTGVECYDSAIVMIDKDQAEVLVTIDRLNVAKIFHAKIKGMHLLATNISLFPRADLTVDVRSVASYMLNGSCLNNHTAFEQVEVLESASHHVFGPGTHRREGYWRFLPGSKSATKWRGKLAEQELWERIVGSVARATTDKHVLLSLSGGYDSGVLLGILGSHLRHAHVTCFSYVHGAPKPGSDAEVAAQRAALYGYEHIAINSYSGDLLSLLEGNANVGEMLRGPSYEIEAFQSLSERYPNADDTVMLFGDECFGWGSYRLNDKNDLLGAINLKSPLLLEPLAALFGQKQMEGLRSGLEIEYEKLLAKVSDFPTPNDAKDFLYQDQRLQFYLLPLRTFVAGHWFPVAMPLISPEIVDVVAEIPTRLRMDKRFFKEIARRRFPQLFAIPRATRGQFHPDFRQEIAAARYRLREVIDARGWGIDGICSPTALSALLDDFNLASANTWGGLRNTVKKKLKAMLATSRLLENQQHWLRRLSYNEFAHSPGRELLALNLLSMAASLASQPMALTSSSLRNGQST
jgi:hypothetical protein